MPTRPSGHYYLPHDDSLLRTAANVEREIARAERLAVAIRTIKDETLLWPGQCEGATRELTTRRQKAQRFVADVVWT